MRLRAQARSQCEDPRLSRSPVPRAFLDCILRLWTRAHLRLFSLTQGAGGRVLGAVLEGLPELLPETLHLQPLRTLFRSRSVSEGSHVGGATPGVGSGSLGQLVGAGSLVPPLGQWTRHPVDGSLVPTPAQSPTWRPRMSWARNAWRNWQSGIARYRSGPAWVTFVGSCPLPSTSGVACAGGTWPLRPGATLAKSARTGEHVASNSTGTTSAMKTC